MDKSIYSCYNDGCIVADSKGFVYIYTTDDRTELLNDSEIICPVCREKMVLLEVVLEDG